jgi:DNA-binding NtrC family response regulator
MPERGDFTILIVDDEEGMRLGLKKTLSLEGYRVLTAATAAEAREAARGRRVHCAFVDLKLPDGSGTELLAALRAGERPWSSSPLSRRWTPPCAMKLGAVDYLQKPFDNHDIVALADRLCLGARDPERSSRDAAAGGDGLVAASPAMKRIVETLRKVMDSEIPLLLQGESGTG